MAVLVAVGAVSGTVLSFDMGLLWPGLMERGRLPDRLPDDMRDTSAPSGGPKYPA